MLHERKQGAGLCRDVCVCVCVAASLTGTHAQVSRQGCPHSGTIFWVRIKGNLRALARTVGEVTRASEIGGDITNLHGEDCGPRLCPLLSLCVLMVLMVHHICACCCYEGGWEEPVWEWAGLAMGSASVTLRRLRSYLLRQKKNINHGEGFFPAGDFCESGEVGACWHVFILTLSIF